MASKRIKKVLVANRGEIAVRVFRACKDLGMSTVAIYSKEDAYNLFRTKADASYLIGEGRTPLGAYLDIEGIIRLAKEKGVDAIHPGYGFLSENPNFARACEQNGITFIGPPSHVLEKMGDKLSAKEIAKACGVPTIPGSVDPLSDVDAAAKTAAEYGYPVILKAAAGGGGKGMRRVNDEDQLRAAFGLVQSEALKSFGNGDIFIEKYLVEPKHIEMQVIADKHGNVVHLFERDCSLQRRYQKVVEVAPAVSVSKEILQKIYGDAIKIAKQVSYVNAGTVEFLVEPSTGKHYFIEMNPRVQVEHTITEMITGVDIVKTQILIAEGRPLSDAQIALPDQASITMNGVAIQCRVTTEDPANRFAPDVGKITVYRSPGGYGVRLDAGNVYPGAEILPYYDSLLVKVCTFDRTFEGATRRARRALGEMRVQGVKTNIQFLTNILNHPKFAEMSCNTTFIDDTPSLYELPQSRDRDTKILTYIGHLSVNGDRGLDAVHSSISPISAIKAPVGGQWEKPDGLKQLLDEKGPIAVRDFCLNSKKLLLSDTTMRDAMQSLLATRVRTKDMAAVADYTAHAMPNLFALEMWGGATFDVAYRYLFESPWDRLSILREKIPNIPFMMLLRGANAVGYTSYPDNVIRQFIKESAGAGIDVFRVFDSLNWLPNMELSIDEVLKQNKLCEGYICYTGDISDPKRDKYNLKYYVEMAKELERRGVHILGIKDMSGLLKPYAAEKLVSTLKNEIGLPIHLHTHDTSGNGVATLLKAAEAGVDIADVAIASMSSLTSQPSMNAMVTVLGGHERDTGLDDEKLLPLSAYWEDARKFYKQFEEGLTTPTTDIYKYEMPGGQYTNLKAQVESLGLGNRWQDVKDKFKEVNEMLGDIVKVTPSSKMVGDFAIFMLQNNLDAQNITEKGKHLSYPDSVVSYFSGRMGQPQGGFPKDLQAVVLKGKEPITGRPGQHLAPADFEKVAEQMKPFCPDPTMRDIVAYCLYPKVVEAFYAHRRKYSDLSTLDTPVFYNGLAPGGATEVEIEEGKILLIHLVMIGDIEDDNTRRVVFELNGFRREISVLDTTLPTQAKAQVEAAAEADPNNPKEVGATLPGMISKLMVRPGTAVKQGDVIVIIEAMKMETTILCQIDGIIDQVLVSEGRTVKSGELIAKLV
ncbi:MAG: pyruvate carboxylase [Oscillospiraceae bacterium]|nr:pyruvate carboxylase [Oscillospiraceae bacterium]